MNRKIQIGAFVSHGDIKGFVVEINGNFARILCRKSWGLDFATVRLDKCDYEGVTVEELSLI